MLKKMTFLRCVFESNWFYKAFTVEMMDVSVMIFTFLCLHELVLKDLLRHVFGLNFSFNVKQLVYVKSFFHILKKAFVFCFWFLRYILRYVMYCMIIITCTCKSIYINELLDFTCIILSKYCTSKETLCEKIVWRVVLFLKLFVQEKGKWPCTEAISEMAFKQGSWTINQCWLWTLTNKIHLMNCIRLYLKLIHSVLEDLITNYLIFLKISTWSQ